MLESTALAMMLEAQPIYGEMNGMQYHGIINKVTRTCAGRTDYLLFYFEDYGPAFRASELSLEPTIHRTD